MTRKGEPGKSTRQLTLPRDLYWQMARHARDESPREACGLLAGDGAKPVAVVPTTNIDPFPVVRYQVAPKDILAFDRLLEERGWRWLGIYHSHTFSEAYPSPIDVANAISALSPGILYLLLSLKAENEERRLATFRLDDRQVASISSRALTPPILRAFTIEGGVVEEVPLVIE
ncbi:MAG: M67 family metallopeptidase [Dehalococcoidia bacterium]